ncbi:DUF5317 domain-containing protein [Kineosporia sp. R_H_3]|uniref:DUF5317 domain-containing protein n=1 Tax=Kineosporia sp. R_H_3 TaxID=1961848 RepID=UPI000B4BCE44|nr:DUF5317 domain-containing protein [Kineosporia sp. R_H_3]
MIVPVCALLAVLAPLLVGGRLRGFAVLRLRRTEVVSAAFVVQFAAVSVLPGPRALLVALHVGSYLAAGAFVVVNRRVPGIVVLGLGALSNGLTIAVNGGTLPASSAALARAGMLEAETLGTAAGLANSGIVADPRLAFLGDVFAVPAGWPLANVFSVGDLLIVLGAGWASLRICGTRWSAPWQGRASGHAKGRHLEGLLVRPAPEPAAPRLRPPARRVAARRGGVTGWAPPTGLTG